MSTIVYRVFCILMLCAFVHESYAAQNVLALTNKLIQQGKTDEFRGNYPKAVAEFRQALIFQLSNPKIDDKQILDSFNLYGESYSRIGLFSIVADQDKDEALLRLMAQHVITERNLNMAKMVHGLLLSFGERKFGIPSKGIQYSYLRADPLEPTCTLERSLPRITSVNDIGELAPCQQKRAFFQLIKPAITSEVKAYRKFEIDFLNKAASSEL